MEDHEKLADAIANAAFMWLKHRGEAAARTEPKNLDLRKDLLVPTVQWFEVIRQCGDAYKIQSHQVLSELEAHFHATIARDFAADAAPAVGSTRVQVEQDRLTLERNRFEFERDYLGSDTIPEQLAAYIRSCALTSAKNRQLYMYPYISIVQSSGFGKSRLLRELAYRTKDDPYGELKVLYTSMRPSGYPAMTFHLRNYFFPSLGLDLPASVLGSSREDRQRTTSTFSQFLSLAIDAGRQVLYGRAARDEPGSLRSHYVNELATEDALAARLVCLYEYAATHWNSVGNEWFELFTSQADAEICERLKNYNAKNDKDTARFAANANRFVVLAIDEARLLLPSTTQRTTSWFERLRRALLRASDAIRDKFGARAGVFVVLVDTNSKVTNFLPAHSSQVNGNVSELFPPFVLTHTMDIRFEALVKAAKEEGASSNQFYQGVVNYGYEDAWATLVSMGRPLWDRVKLNRFDEREERANVIRLAAEKLLGGLSPRHEESFQEGSLFGVASMLCRVGVRPFSWSPFASRAVAELMAVLVHTNFTHDQLLSTYSSDPILTFGAACVWYDSAPDDDPHARLVACIIPQLRKLLRQEVVDTGGVGELVSRVVLLLAMDATGAVVASASTDNVTLKDLFQYAGEFHSVETFLKVLYGGDNKPESVVVCDGFRDDVTEDYASQVNDWLETLREWNVGFSHFVQVTEEPNEQVLWILLARRAAGIFPRNCKGVDLFIPIFQGGSVSMILVQVKNRAVGDPDSPDSASVAMWPSSVFTNELKLRRPSEVVRVYMSLRGAEPTERKQFYMIDKGVRRSPRLGPSDLESFVLCLEGLGPWKTKRGDGATYVPVASEAVAKELRELLTPWWNVIDQVEADLERRGQRFGLADTVIRSIASRPLVESLLTPWPATDFSTETPATRSAEKHPRSPSFTSEESTRGKTDSKRGGS